MKIAELVLDYNPNFTVNIHKLLYMYFAVSELVGSVAERSKALV